MARIIQTILNFFRRLFGRTERLPAPVSPPTPASIPPRLVPLPQVEPDPEEDVEEDVEDDDTPPTHMQPRLPEEFQMSRPTLSRGADDKGAVRELQILLNGQGESLTLDGDYGPGTEKAVKAYQVSYGLPETGVVDQAVWLTLDRQSYGKDLAYQGVPLEPTGAIESSSDVAKAWNTYGNLLSMLGDSLGIAPSVACAVLATESAGEGFWDGRMVIRFENHIFKSRSDVDENTFLSHFQMDNGKRWLGHKWRPDGGAWRELHTKVAGQYEEWAVLKFARTLDDTGALMSISMGAPQIMGFNHETVGFATVQEMFAAFSQDERAHVLGLFDFIRSNHKMVRALASGDWSGFARIYNGSGQAEHYGQIIWTKVAEAKNLGIT